MLNLLRFDHRDYFGVPETDRVLADHDACDRRVQEIYTRSLAQALASLGSAAPAVAVPYNCGALIATPGGRLVGIDVALIADHYYGGRRWEIPRWLYGLAAERLDMLVVSHGHLDHCWIELIRAMIERGKTVIVPEGIRACGIDVPWGCRGVANGTEFWWEGMHFAFTICPHVYDNGRNIPVLTTRLWDGQRVYLHTSDSDTTFREAFHWYDRYPVDVLLFKLGGVSPCLDEYEELVRAVERIDPRQLILPMHLSELAHKGTEAAMPYGRAYELMMRCNGEGRLGRRRYGVLFGNRAVRLAA